MLAVTGRGLPSILLLLALPLPLAASGGSPPLTLTVTPSKNEFTHDDTPSLKLTLELAASAVTPVTVSTYADGSIHVRRLTRNGVRLKPQRMMVSFFEDPCLGNIGWFLVTLAPGEGASVSGHMLVLERGLSGDLELWDIRCKRGATWHKGVLVYSLPAHGVYELQLTYRYTGADGGCEHVFRGDVPSNVVTLNLR